MLHVELRDVIKEHVQHQNIQIKLENPTSILNDTNLLTSSTTFMVEFLKITEPQDI